ncbi:hypothetical protein KR018_009787 [Drosophila ironensis]|nr:hypothetical protein KR018_009787 [Drosophila ironensis]
MARIQFLLLAGLALSFATRQQLRVPLYSRHSPMPNAFIDGNLGRGLHLLLTNRENVEYYGQIAMGNPRQNFSVVFDTGSTNTWLPSANCPKDNQACQTHRRYNSSRSSTYSPNGRNFTLNYGSGKVKGYLSQDTVHFSGADMPGLIFGEVLIHQLIKSNTLIFDGLVGLGLGNLAWNNTTPFLKLLCNQNLVNECMFSVYLQRTEDEGVGGEIIFGGVDKSRFTGRLHYVPIAHANVWKLTISKAFAGTSLIDANMDALLDTGTSYILMPRQTYDNLLAIMPGESKGIEYILNCRRNALPHIQLIIGGKPFYLAPKDYLIEVELEFKIICITAFVPVNLDFWVLGDIFLRRYYTVFDATGKRIGLAESVLNAK